MAQGVDAKRDRLVRSCIADGDFDRVIRVPHGREIGLKRRARPDKLNRACNGKIGGARIKDGGKTKELSSGDKAQRMAIELLGGTELVDSGGQFAETKFSISPGRKRVCEFPVFLAFSYFAPIEVRANAHVAFRTWKVDVPDDQGFGIEINDDL